MNSLKDVLVEGLQDLHDAEQQITRALPLMAEKAKHPQLKQAFEEHLQQTQQQIRRLEQISQQMGVSARGKSCRAMQGLIHEAQDGMKQFKDDGDTCDAYMIAAAQKVEHYEMAAYGSARTWAQQLGESQVAQLLQTTLDEEGQTDKRLTQLAEGMVNVHAQKAA